MTRNVTSDWLALLHQLPVKPPYLRVKIWRRLQAAGAVPLKNAAHVLPRSEESLAAFQAILEEVVANGGEAILLRVQLLAGQTDLDVRALFDAARDAEYEEIRHTAKRLLDNGPPSAGDIAKLERRLAEAERLDFFGAHGRQAAKAALAEVDRQRYRHPDVSRSEAAETVDATRLVGRTWVTRRGIHVDRIACAWLIGRFIDPAARFRFVDAKAYRPADGELRFDMADAEFTHEGDRCSFETLVLRSGHSHDPGLCAIGEIIHELDIADGKFARPETAGVSAMLSGVCASTEDDIDRISRASAALDQLYAFFSDRKNDR